MNAWMKRVNKEQRGFTIIEILVSIAIAGVLAAGIVATIHQTFKVNESANEHMVTVQQVENAGYWVNKDALMAQTITPGGGAGFPLSLSWISWAGNSMQVTYNLSGDSIRRSVSVNGGAPTQVLVAQNVDPDPLKTSCSFADSVLTLNVTAAVDDTFETRTYRIKPRPDGAIY